MQPRRLHRFIRRNSKIVEIIVGLMTVVRKQCLLNTKEHKNIRNFNSLTRRSKQKSIIPKYIDDRIA